MSTSDPGSQPATEHAEVVGPPSGSAGSSGRKYVASFSVAVLAVGAVTAGVWAWRAWADQGAQPAEALPGNTLAYAAIDLDPPGGQKLAAYKMLRKFPSLKKELGLGSAEDLQKAVVEEATTDSACDLDYGDFKGWVGDRAAFAVVPQDRVEPVAVVQVGDRAKARAALDAVKGDCGLGYAVTGDWVVLAETDGVARRVTRDAARATLADDKDFRRLVGKAGDPGLVTLYAAPEAGPALLDAIEDDPFAAEGVLWSVSSAVDPVSSFFLFFRAFSVQSEFEAAPDVSPALQRKLDRLDRQMAHLDELSPREQKRLIRQQQKLFEEVYGSVDELGSGDDEYLGDPDVAEPAPQPVDPALRAALQDFAGLGGVGRFAGDGLEVEVVGDDLEGIAGDLYDGADGAEMTADLPGDTAIAFGAGFADHWVDALFRPSAGQAIPDEAGAQGAIVSFEKETGLDLPADLEALGGEGITVVVGSGFDPDRLWDGGGAPVAVRISGDADRIEPALDKLRAGLGRHAAESLQSRRIDGGVLVGPDADHLDALAKGGRLADSDRFHQAVPDAGKATSVLFVDFDAGDWLVKSVGARDRRDAEPLDALGLTVTKEHGELHLRYRLSFD